MESSLTLSWQHIWLCATGPIFELQFYCQVICWPLLLNLCDVCHHAWQVLEQAVFQSYLHSSTQGFQPYVQGLCLLWSKWMQVLLRGAGMCFAFCIVLEFWYSHARSQRQQWESSDWGILSPYQWRSYRQSYDILEDNDWTSIFPTFFFTQLVAAPVPRQYQNCWRTKCASLRRPQTVYWDECVMPLRVLTLNTMDRTAE